MTVCLKAINSVKENCKLHSIPSKIHADDKANVSLYFKPIDTGDGKLSSSFRGYPLDGIEVRLPESYGGYVFRESQKNEIEGQDRNLILSSRFNALTYWNWNKIPTRSDPFIAAFDWMDISQTVHDSIEEE